MIAKATFSHWPEHVNHRQKSTLRSTDCRRVPVRMRPMVEVSPHLSLAFALHSNPGTYALLLGAGVSLPAGVPAAWQVLHSLIGELAVASEREWPADPEAWWTQAYGAPPTYDGVLEALTNSAEERRTLLAQFFEPTPEERDEGKKQPTAAHHACESVRCRPPDATQCRSGWSGRLSRLPGRLLSCGLCLVE
jgi:hypothetical protein